jgi:hypothetical protein
MMIVDGGLQRNNQPTTGAANARGGSWGDGDSNGSVNNGGSGGGKDNSVDSNGDDDDKEDNNNNNNDNDNNYNGIISAAFLVFGCGCAWGW